MKFKKLYESVNTHSKRKKMFESEELDKLKQFCREFNEEGITSSEVYERALQEMKDDRSSKVHYTLALANMLNEMEDDELSDACWDGYEAYGFKQKAGKRVPNCVPENEEINENDVADSFERSIVDKMKSHGDNWKNKLSKEETEFWNNVSGKSRKEMKRKAKTLAEHEDYESYVDDWRNKGFEISVKDLRGKGSKRFSIKDYGIIVEPEQGEYYIKGDDTKYKSFDEAMEALTMLNEKKKKRRYGSEEAEAISESSDLTRMLRLAGVKKL